MLSFIKTLLQASAWPIQTPEPYSAFHILLCAAGIPLAVFLARRLARTGTHPCGVLFICGLVLAVSELYKQGFLYFVAGQGRYNWWYFPFQLCSVPMYLCLILPLFKHTPHCRTEKCICTFMQDFALLGGVMALAEPSGLMHPYLLLTLHGFLWHFMLIFIGLYCAMTGLGGRSPRRLCIHAPSVFGLRMHSHVHKCGFPSLRQCRYVLYQPLLSKRTDCFPPDCPHHRYGRRKPSVPGSHGSGRLYLPPVPGPAVSPVTVLTVSAAARLQPSIQTFRFSVMQIFSQSKSRLCPVSGRTQGGFFHALFP